jgi:predicted permease
VFKLISVGLIGAYYIKETERPLISKLVFNVFTPTLIFYNMAKFASFHQIIVWWSLPTNLIIHTFFGLFIGWIISLFSPKEIRNIILAATSMGNNNSLPLILASSIIIDGPILTYVSIVASMSTLIRFSLGNYLLSPPVQNYIPLVSIEPVSDIDDTEKRFDYYHIIKIKYLPTIQKILCPPIISAIISLIVASVTKIQSSIFQTNAPLSFIADTTKTLSACAIPCIILNLGSVLRKKRLGHFPITTLCAIILTRFIILPLIGSLIVYFAVKNKVFVPPDNGFTLILLIINTMPTGINLHGISVKHKYGEEEIATIIFWQYLIAVAVVPINLYVCMKVLPFYRT